MLNKFVIIFAIKLIHIHIHFCYYKCIISVLVLKYISTVFEIS